MCANTFSLSSAISVLEHGSYSERDQERILATFNDKFTPFCNIATENYMPLQSEHLRLSLDRERCSAAVDSRRIVPLRNGDNLSLRTESQLAEMPTDTLSTLALSSSGDLPSIEEITDTLQRCRRSNNSNLAKQVHAGITYFGLDVIDQVENHIVPMLVDCGCMLHAQQIFHKSTFRNEHSWTAIILGCVSSGDMDEMFDLYADMKKCGTAPTMFTVLALLKACIKFHDVQKGQEVHTEAVELGLDQDSSINSSLIDMYAKSGFLPEASHVLTALPIQNVISWTALISGYADKGLGDEALALFGKMQSEGILPNAVTIACLLKALDSVATKNSMGKFVQNIKAIGYERDPLIDNGLIGIYSRLGFKKQALDIFTAMKNRDLVSWNSLISGHVDCGDAKEAMIHFEKMLRDHVSPDVVTFISVCKACASLGAMEEALRTHTEIIKRGLEDDPSLVNSVSFMYTKCGLILEAVQVFDKLLVKDVVSWSVLIAGYAKLGPSSEAINCFKQMKLEGIVPTPLTFTSVLRACASAEILDSGHNIHTEIELKGFAHNVHVSNALIAMYAKCDSLMEAEYVFNMQPDRDVLSWNTIITGFAEHGSGRKALKYYEEMQANGFQPDAISVSSALKACATIAALESGREIHARLSEDLFATDPCNIGNNLINMYAKSGSLSEAQGVFHQLPLRDVVVWSSMIHAFGINNEGQQAIECFEEMQKQDVAPNDVTFTCLLSACRHASLAQEGDKYFKAMREDFGVIPSVEHFNCMIDLLARSGHLIEAEKLCELLGFSAEGALSALLTASRICGETELGLRCFHQTIKSDFYDAGLYVLMTDILASAGRINEASQIEHLRRHLGAYKIPATAVIEIGDEVHEFVVGNNQSRQIVEMLSSLNTEMRGKGNVSNLEPVLAVISDREKEASLCEHAEKIALAFGLLHTPEGHTLRVTKNLRMCRECHDAGIFISKEKKREIVIRDSCCVHHFKGGFCSCGDMF